MSAGEADAVLTTLALGVAAGVVALTIAAMLGAVLLALEILDRAQRLWRGR